MPLIRPSQKIKSLRKVRTATESDLEEVSLERMLIKRGANLLIVGLKTPAKKPTVKKK